MMSRTKTPRTDKLLKERRLEDATDYRQHLRESTLDATKGKPMKKRADALNMIEAIISGDMTSDQIVDAVLNDTMPVVYKPLKRKVHNARIIDPRQ